MYVPFANKTISPSDALWIVSPMVLLFNGKEIVVDFEMAGIETNNIQNIIMVLFTSPPVKLFIFFLWHILCIPIFLIDIYLNIVI
jgi:hypothetical protein